MEISDNDRQAYAEIERVWRACLAAFDWPSEKIDEFVGERRRCLEPGPSGDWTLHEHALHGVAYHLIPSDLLASDPLRLSWDVQHVIETPNGVTYDPWRQYDRDFDWSAARKRVDSLFERIRRNEIKPGEWTEKLFEDTRKQQQPPR